ncbi:hypothetical protein [Lacticaseibacillus manihotivorans]|uniref:Uncharacterized protein n=1 Tax=Lacticaseibacillus manihotivorans DSM 13343 = JCM 12514 TaxID=1423769 RepID=A0A0R1QHM8_9LACO|nr:hypothetical protein [Lacticaseibacillus manihotivorans]KRL44301.1 hypothetical protein FD01_GL001202 [Lacticaseibacillus manihotivorans DSM 13343 = JCM 12514]
MSDKPEIVQIKMDKPMKSEVQAPTAALRIKINQNKNIVVYNRINGYILDALMKAVFNDAH